MPYDPRFHHRRRSIRLPGYDYTTPGAYFVTIVTHNRARLFGEIVGGEMRLNEWGKIIETCWHEIPVIYRYVEIDEYIVMPNHIHGIIIILENDKSTQNVGATQWVAPTNAGIHLAHTVGTIIGQFKSAATKQIILSRHMPDVQIWQRNYYACPERQRGKHIVRNENDLSQIREYIQNNPIRWEIDGENYHNS